MTDSALLKIGLAAKHIMKLNELIGKKRPFVFVVRTNTLTSERFLFVKKNEAIVNEAALICGDAVHNLRSALDHAYWELVSPHCTSDQERRRIQFPFTTKANEFGKALHDAYAQRAGTGFYSAIRDLQSYGEPGGNQMLFLVREADNLDKHRLLIPSIGHIEISRQRLCAAIPDWPAGAQFRKLILSGFKGKIRWVNAVAPTQRGEIVPPSFHIFERELDIPVDIVLEMGEPANPRPMIATLHKMVDAVHKAIALMRERAKSY